MRPFAVAIFKPARIDNMLDIQENMLPRVMRRCGAVKLARGKANNLCRLSWADYHGRRGNKSASGVVTRSSAPFLPSPGVDYPKLQPRTRRGLFLAVEKPLCAGGFRRTRHEGSVTRADLQRKNASCWRRAPPDQAPCISAPAPPLPMRRQRISAASVWTSFSGSEGFGISCQPCQWPGNASLCA